MLELLNILRKNLFIVCLTVACLFTFTLVYQSKVISQISENNVFLPEELVARVKYFGAQYKQKIPLYKGVPKRILIFSHEGSGYEFFEKLLHKIPAIFMHEVIDNETKSHHRAYNRHHKKLIYIQTTDISSDIKSKLECNDARNMYISETTLFSESLKIYCAENPQYSVSSSFMNYLCMISSVQVLIFKGVSLSNALKLLAVYKDLHVIYLARDPRAISHESKLDFKVKNFCNVMDDDFFIAKQMLRLYKEKFRLLRFEDLSYNLEIEVKEFHEKLGLNLTAGVNRLISSTKGDIDKRVVTWLDNMSYKEVEKIQEECAQTLLNYAYKIYINEDDFKVVSRPMNDLESKLRTVLAEAK